MQPHHLNSPPSPSSADLGSFSETPSLQCNQSSPQSLRHLPIANVSRIMKDALDTSTKISKESKETIQKCVTEFISLITFEACERCKIEQRKTIIGDDIIHGLETFAFGEYARILKVYLAKYREAVDDGQNIIDPEEDKEDIDNMEDIEDMEDEGEEEEV